MFDVVVRSRRRSVLAEGGTRMVVRNASENVSTRVLFCRRHQKQSHLLRIYTRAEGGQRTVTVTIRATVIASHIHYSSSVTSHNKGMEPLGRNIRIKIRATIARPGRWRASDSPPSFSQLLNRYTNGLTI
jgi:hypothetical protein